MTLLQSQTEFYQTLFFYCLGVISRKEAILTIESLIETLRSQP